MIKSQLFPVNLLSADSHPNWKVVRYPFTDAAPEVLDKMMPGFLVKFNAGGTAVLPALAADDAVLAGVIVDPPDLLSNPDDTTVAVAFSGSFNQRVIHYANAWSESPPSALSVAAIERLRDVGIYLDPSVPNGEFVP
jgi:hypothetical protein